ncbi:MAG: ribosome biogenesis GTPase Der [Puniceicoccales bacterium]|jgi:GTP-binding protein|nr:ribosome biogenesis GTPase Der [Puniceicoccales bacterium]
MSAVTEIPRSVAIVGRPNVGKSRLFNRLVGRRVSIVHDMPGVTRDLITEQVRDGNYLLMDTGGIGLFTALTPKVIADAVEEQVGFAINAAGVILLVVDINEGCTPLDLEIAQRLRRFGKKVILVANKADNEARAANHADFFGMNLGSPIVISAEHGIGIDFLVAKIKADLGPEPEVETASPASSRIRLCLAGRPNVGKSSIGNRLLKADRLIVSEVAGTTRDPVRTQLDYTNADGDVWNFELIDTAGRRAQTRHDALDFFSELRSNEALSSADIVYLVLDAQSGVTRLDKQLAGKISEAGSGLVVVVNKWDLALKQFREKDGGIDGFESESEFRKTYYKAVNRELFFLPKSPVLFMSALENIKVADLLAAGHGVYERMNGFIPTAQINKVVHDLMERQPPRMVSGRRFKCYYAVQVGNKPLCIRMFCNSKERVSDQYERYLIAGLYEAFDLDGVPVKLEFVGKPKDPERKFFLGQQSETVGSEPKNKAVRKSASKPTASGAKNSPAKSSRPRAKAGSGTRKGGGPRLSLKARNKKPGGRRR